MHLYKRVISSVVPAPTPIHILNSVRVVGQQNRLPRKAVDAPAPEVFKARLDKALKNLVRWKVSLPMAGLVGSG